MPTLSIIMPIYNGELFVETAIDSILANEYTDFELLITDDGSTDRSGGICDAYANTDGRITVFHTENRGLSAARNHALQYAKGRYISFFDSDDYVERDMFGTLVNNLEEYGADISICSRVVETVGNPCAVKREGEPQFFGRDALLRVLLTDTPFAAYAHGKVYRREMFSNIRFCEGRMFEDLCINYYLYKEANKAVYTPKELYHYVHHIGGLSHGRFREQLFDYFETIDEIAGEMRSREGVTDYDRSLLGGMALSAAFWFSAELANDARGKKLYGRLCAIIDRYWGDAVLYRKAVISSRRVRLLMPLYSFSKKLYWAIGRRLLTFGMSWKRYQ